MNTSTTRDYPARLAKLQERFERWRRTHPPRSRIAETLWGAAVKAALRYGLCRTAQALRLDYYALKKRMEGTSGVACVSRKEKAAAKFLELPPLVTGSSERTSAAAECMLEWEAAGGGRMRLHFPRIATTDLALLCRSLRS